MFKKRERHRGESKRRGRKVAGAELEVRQPCLVRYLEGHPSLHALAGEGDALRVDLGGEDGRRDVVGRAAQVAECGERGAARASLGLGAAERLLLDELESGIRDLERRLPEVGAPPPPACGDADLVAFRERAASLAKAEHGRFFADRGVLAFQLDLTRVVSLTHFSEGGDTDRGKRTNVDVASWFRVRDGGYDPDGERVDTFHHHLSHYGDGAREAGWERAVNRWAYAHVAYLAMRMDELPGTTGSMLDDSLVFHLGSGGNGKTHRGENTPCLLLGSAGGAIPQGEYRGVRRARHGRAVASAAVALGVSEGAFGSEGGDPLF